MADDLDEELEVSGDTLRLTVDVVASFVANHNLPPDQIPGVIRAVHKTLASLARGGEEQEAESRKPAVPINKSVHADFIVCLEDGRKLKMLKRYLRTAYKLSPEEYRQRWGLAPDYPMIAPSYSARRSDSARRIGLGKGARPTRTR